MKSEKITQDCELFYFYAGVLLVLYNIAFLSSKLVFFLFNGCWFSLFNAGFLSSMPAGFIFSMPAGFLSLTLVFSLQCLLVFSFHCLLVFSLQRWFCWFVSTLVFSLLLCWSRHLYPNTGYAISLSEWAQ